MDDQINRTFGDGRLIPPADPRLFASPDRHFDLLTVADALAKHAFALPVGQPAGDLLIEMVDTDRSPGELTMGGVEIELILEAAVVGSK